nr:50S ribosomal protein L5 [uncultured archaeon]
MKKNTGNSDMEQNIMRTVKIDKVVLSVGGTGEELEKGMKLLKVITDKNPSKRKSRKRIPSLGVRPNLEVGAMVTLRKNFEEILGKTLAAVNNTMRKKQVVENHFSFGIHEYIEIPGIEYQRDIGIIGLDITVVFKRTGKRVGIRKIKTGRVSKKQAITKEEIIKFMEENFSTKFR